MASASCCLGDEVTVPTAMGSASCCLGDKKSQAWIDKAVELGERGFELEKLLDFYGRLGPEGDLMPHFDFRVSTTNDVVRQAIIPASRGSGGKGKALSQVFHPSQPIVANHLVSHTWSSPFGLTVFAMVQEAIDAAGCHWEGNRENWQLSDVCEYCNPCQIQSLKELLAGMDTRILRTTFWFCAVSVNQHDNICGSFAPPSAGESEQERRHRVSQEFDSVSGKKLPICRCTDLAEKNFNDKPDACEINKFDDMILSMHTSCETRGQSFSLVVSIDPRCDLFWRIWCLAELVKARELGLRIHTHLPPKYLWQVVPQQSGEQALVERLNNLKVQECRATRADDRADLLKTIGDSSAQDAFNKFVHNMLFDDPDGLRLREFDPYGNINPYVMCDP